jgi:hypothetical protein
VDWQNALLEGGEDGCPYSSAALPPTHLGDLTAMKTPRSGPLSQRGIGAYSTIGFSLRGITTADMLGEDRDAPVQSAAAKRLYNVEIGDMVEMKCVRHGSEPARIAHLGGTMLDQPTRLTGHGGVVEQGHGTVAALSSVEKWSHATQA